MASAAFPSVVTAIVSTAATALAPVRVVRGRDISNEPGDVVMVGTHDVEADQYDAGSFQQGKQTFGGGRMETGTVNGLVLAWNGQADQDLACSTAFDHLALLEAAVRADPTLGLTAYDDVVAELQAGDVTESQSSEGATTALSFTIAYTIQNI
jgi:hypothetical protein